MHRTSTWLALTWNRLDPSWRAALPAWLAGRVGFSLWAYWIWLQQLMPVTPGEYYRGVPPLLNGWQGALLGMWQRWDGIYYQIIVEQLYSSAKVSAFFPAYPVLSRVVMQLTGLSSVSALLLVSSLATLFSLVLLFRTARDLFPDSAVAGLAVERAVLFPTAFFLFGIYPQSLALLWMLLAYRQAQRGRWLVAALAGLLAGLTHVTIIALAAMLALQILPTLRASRSSRQDIGTMWLQRLALLSVPALPLLGAALFLVWRDFMDFPSIAAMQTQSWDRYIAFPWTTLWVLVTGFPGNYLGNWVLFLNTALLVLSVAVIIFGLTIPKGAHRAETRRHGEDSFALSTSGASGFWGQHRVPLALTIYQAVLVLFTLSSGLTFDPLQSFDRYILALFPIYFALACVARGRTGRAVYFAVSLLLSLGISAMFFMWKWIG